MEHRFLNRLLELIEENQTAEITNWIDANVDTEITEEEIIAFSRISGNALKEKLQGAVNLNGSGGSQLIKPNISSIAAMYLARSIDVPVIKTGSGAYTGIYGSTQFFRELDLLDFEHRECVLDTFGFAYYDYYEVSPWKRYKKELFKNVCLKELFWKIVFFDYEASHYFLGISNPAYYEGLQRLRLENKPEKLHVFHSSFSNGVVLDEMADGRIYWNHQLVYEGQNYGYSFPTLSLAQLKAINVRLLRGEETGFWKEAVKLTCSHALLQMGAATDMDEARDIFEESYGRKKAWDIWKEINK